MPAAVTRLRPSRVRTGHTYDFAINGLAGQLTVTDLPDGRAGEVFLKVGKQGSTLAGLCEALSLMTSLALQHQVPLVEIVRRLLNMRFEPAGLTGDSELPQARSLADYLARRLALDYLNHDELVDVGVGVPALAP
jgi:ribonucleoside-diphosphate reductase alpha chain